MNMMNEEMIEATYFVISYRAFLSAAHQICVISSVSRRVGLPETVANIIIVCPFLVIFTKLSGSLPTISSGLNIGG